MTNHYRLLKLYLLRVYPICEVCGIRRSTDCHHMLYHRMKGRQELDCVQNCSAVCHECHMNGIVNSHKARETHWAKRTEEGYQLREWVDSLQLKSKEYFGG